MEENRICENAPEHEEPVEEQCFEVDYNALYVLWDFLQLGESLTAESVKRLLDDSIEDGMPIVAIPNCHLAGAKRYVGDKIKLAAVVGAPNGYMTSATKAFEAKDAIANGVEDIIMLINNSMLRDEDYKALEADIKAVKTACGEHKMLVYSNCRTLTAVEIEKITSIANANDCPCLKMLPKPEENAETTDNND